MEELGKSTWLRKRREETVIAAAAATAATVAHVLTIVPAAVRRFSIYAHDRENNERDSPTGYSERKTQRGLPTVMDNSSLSAIWINHSFTNEAATTAANGGAFSWIDFNVSTSPFYNVTQNGVKVTCGNWEPAHNNLFQFSNMCFLSAFVIPRSYKSSILLLRFMLSVSFIITAIWAGVYICALDSFVWSCTLAVINGLHSIVLLYKFLPPALSLELTELYIKLFKPLKVSRKHFKELTKEASLLSLNAGRVYATEDVTPADEKLSILLRGRLKVTRSGTFMHNISCFQFVDSPEWQGNTTASGIRFQVTITAEEESVYLCWSRLKLDRILRHRPQVKFVFNNLIGKDITQKMYSLNEQVGFICTTEAMSRAAREDHWRLAMNRSISVDAVNTGAKGYVHSIARKQAEKQKRNNSIYSENESPLLGQQQCWLPVVASQFPTESPFIKEEDTGSQDEMKELLPANSVQKMQQDQQQIQLLTQTSNIENAMQQIPLLNVTANSSLLNTQSVALIPVIVPVLTAPMSGANQITAVNALRPTLKQSRGVKFDETCL